MTDYIVTTEDVDLGQHNLSHIIKLGDSYENTTLVWVPTQDIVLVSVSLFVKFTISVSATNYHSISLTDDGSTVAYLYTNQTAITAAVKNSMIVPTNTSAIDSASLINIVFAETGSPEPLKDLVIQIDYRIA